MMGEAEEKEPQTSSHDGDNQKNHNESDGKVGLVRQVTLLGGVAIIVGSMIGSGIFASPVGVLRQTESVGMSLIIWLLCGILATFGKVFVQISLIRWLFEYENRKHQGQDSKRLHSTIFFIRIT